MPEIISNNEDTSEQKTILRDQFLSFYSERGYVQSDPLPLLSGDFDESVIFTSATINGWKKYLVGEELAVPGVCTVQPCLRNQNLREVYDIESIQPFSSQFNMAGVISPIECKTQVLDDATTFLLDGLNISPENILVDFSSEHPDLQEYQDGISGKGINTETDRINWYNWRYGMGDAVKGRGITFSTRGSTRSEFGEIGNFVIIDNEGVDKVVEWGFGLETILARIHGSRHPISYSNIMDYIPSNVTETIAGMKLADSVSAFSAILSQGVKFNTVESELKSLQEKYVKGICYLASVLGLDQDWVTQTIKTYSEGNFGSKLSDDSECFGYLRNYFKKYEERKNSFLESIIRIIRNPVAASRGRDNTVKSLRLTATNNGINNNLQAVGMILAASPVFGIDDKELELLRDAFSRS